MGSRPYVLVGVLLCAAFALRLPGRDISTLAESSRDGYFSGIVTVLSSAAITVSRSVLGNRSSTRTFIITGETRIEGEPRVNAKVTVRFVPGEGHDRAVHIIVRSDAADREKR